MFADARFRKALKEKGGIRGLVIHFCFSNHAGAKNESVLLLLGFSSFFLCLKGTPVARHDDRNGLAHTLDIGDFATRPERRRGFRAGFAYDHKIIEERAEV